jgi:hypothetical protein
MWNKTECSELVRNTCRTKGHNTIWMQTTILASTFWYHRNIFNTKKNAADASEMCKDGKWNIRGENVSDQQKESSREVVLHTVFYINSKRDPPTFPPRLQKYVKDLWYTSSFVT